MHHCFDILVLQNYTNKKLQKILRQLDLSIYGTKCVLIKRIINSVFLKDSKKTLNNIKVIKNSSKIIEFKRHLIKLTKPELQLLCEKIGISRYGTKEKIVIKIFKNRPNYIDLENFLINKFLDSLTRVNL